MFRNIAKVRLGLVKVLNQVIPDMPFPDNFSRCLSGRFDFQNAFRQQLAFYSAGVSPGSNRLFVRFGVRGDHKNIPIRKPTDIMMRTLLAVLKRKIPNEFSVPIEFLNSAARSGAPIAEACLRSRPQQVTIFEQITA